MVSVTHKTILQNKWFHCLTLWNHLTSIMVSRIILHKWFLKPFNSLKKKLIFIFWKKNFRFFWKKVFDFFSGKNFQKKVLSFFGKSIWSFFGKNFRFFFGKKFLIFPEKKFPIFFREKNSFYINCKKLAIIIVYVLVCNFKSK